jgi:hypothetical protein
MATIDLSARPWISAWSEGRFAPRLKSSTTVSTRNFLLHARRISRQGTGANQAKFSVKAAF